MTFTVPKGSVETHTATTGPGNPDNASRSPTSARSPSGQDDPRLAYPSDAPPAAAALTPLLHGNGFWNSGALDARRRRPLPQANKVTFAAAGTYEFYCLIHPFMHGTITAQ